MLMGVFSHQQEALLLYKEIILGFKVTYMLSVLRSCARDQCLLHMESIWSTTNSAS